MAELTDDDLDRMYACSPLLPAPGGEVVRQLIDALRHERRAVVGAHPTGPDQGEPVVWLENQDGRRVVPLGLVRAREAQTTAPRADEVDAAARFRPGDFVTVADGATVGEYVGYEGGPFHRHRYRLVWPDGTRAPEVSAADDPRVAPADPAVLTEYGIHQGGAR